MGKYFSALHIYRMLAPVVSSLLYVLLLSSLHICEDSTTPVAKARCTSDWGSHHWYHILQYTQKILILRLPKPQDISWERQQPISRSFQQEVAYQGGQEDLIQIEHDRTKSVERRYHEVHCTHINYNCHLVRPECQRGHSSRKDRLPSQEISLSPVVRKSVSASLFYIQVLVFIQCQLHTGINGLPLKPKTKCTYYWV